MGTDGTEGLAALSAGGPKMQSEACWWRGAFARIACTHGHGPVDRIAMRPCLDARNISPSPPTHARTHARTHAPPPTHTHTRARIPTHPRTPGRLHCRPPRSECQTTRTPPELVIRREDWHPAGRCQCHILLRPNLHSYWHNNF